MNLPEPFTTRMKQYFEQHPDVDPDLFFESFDENSWKGIRINRLKVHEDDTEQILITLGIPSDPVPWCSDGNYFADSLSGKDPYYHAGVYYIQEPSAMLPAEILGVQPGEMVLDLCAAPGGKATRLGADLRGEGLLVANEISEDRSRALLRNIELFGIENVVITNETPLKLEKHFPLFFDRILMDAPCSGEGMFRRDRNAVRSWERYGPASCEVLQKEILSAAHHMLKPGGHMVYSTCTFGSSENEDMIDWFLSTYASYEVISHPDIPMVSSSSGRKFSGAMRIWPQLCRGDGHFCVHLIKTAHIPGSEIFPDVEKGKKKDPSLLYTSRSARDALLVFAKEILTEESYLHYSQKVEKQFFLQGDKIHLLSVSPSMFDRLKVMKMGAFPGEIKITPNGRIFLPSHAFALSLKKDAVSETHAFTFDKHDERLQRYLRGETILLTTMEGQTLSNNAYVLIFLDSFPIGWGKRHGETIKNLYPKSWRLQ